MEFTSVNVGRYGMSLLFERHEEEGHREIKLVSMADICLSKENLFKSAGDHNIIRSSDMHDLHAALGCKVIDFKPLKKNRACKIDLGNCTIYSWAGGADLPDHLFIAYEYFQSKDIDWWLIDDLS